MIGRVSPITGTWNGSAGRKDGARSLLKEHARRGVSLLSWLDRDMGHAAVPGGHCCIKQTEVWAYFDFAPNGELSCSYSDK